MQQATYRLFETSLGWCGIAWNVQAAVVLLQLPEATGNLTEASVRQRLEICAPGEPPPDIAQTIWKIVRHLNGEPQDFQDIPLDPGGISPFARKVYAAARKIPAGRTMTYGGLAAAVGAPGAARAVGGALGRNPIALLIPCHRILAAGDKPGGFSAPGGNATKAKMLAAEGARLP